MNNYLIYNWSGQLRWADVGGCYLVDPAYEGEFLAAFTDARRLPLNMTFI